MRDFVLASNHSAMGHIVRPVVQIVYVIVILGLCPLGFPGGDPAGPLASRLGYSLTNLIVFTVVGLVLTRSLQSGRPLIGTVALSIQLTVYGLVILLLLLFFSSSSPTGPHTVSLPLLPTYWYQLLHQHGGLVILVFQPAIAIWRNNSGSSRVQWTLAIVLMVFPLLFISMTAWLFQINSQ